jgi:purine nucleosidase
VHKYPGEVIVWSGAPLTNIALALKLDSSVATLARELVVMGGGLYADTAGIRAGDGRREFNWWFDPEAARIVLRAPWKKVTITPIDISIKTRYTPDIHAAVVEADTPLTRYLAQYSLPGYMWDEIAGIALIEPSIITDQRQLYVDVEIDHGPSYGQTLFWEADAVLPPYERLANVQFDLDAKRFYEIYIDLMTRRSSSSCLDISPG